MSFKERLPQMVRKYRLDTIHIVKTIFSSLNKLIFGNVVISFSVVADQIIVQKIVIFLNFFTLKGWTNFIGIKVRIDKNIITIKLIYRFVFKI